LAFGKTNTEYNDFVLIDIVDKVCVAPTIYEILRYFRNVQGLYVNNVPEFYSNGINFCWQILWYTPKEKWEYRKNDPEQPIRHTLYEGTYLYGDNNEFPTQEDADLGAIKLMIEIAKIGKDIYLEEMDEKRLERLNPLKLISSKNYGDDVLSKEGLNQFYKEGLY